ncbi:hypothetical protein ACLKA7_003886 [Drosophila subpalustris]
MITMSKWQQLEQAVAVAATVELFFWAVASGKFISLNLIGSYLSALP